jgi:VWFA-related protein
VASLKKVNAPQSICLLIDNSNSMKTRLPALKAAVARFISGLPPDDEVCVATIGPALAIRAKLTQDHAAASSSLTDIEARGASALIDGIMNAADYMRDAARNRSRTFVLFSDGLDNRSLADSGTLLQQMERSGSPVLYMVNFTGADGAPGEEQGFQGVIEDAVIRGGGTICAPADEKVLAAALAGLGEQLHGRYLLVYTAERPERDGHERQLKVSLSAAYAGKGVSIRAPGGYYAPLQ